MPISGVHLLFLQGFPRGTLIQGGTLILRGTLIPDLSTHIGSVELAQQQESKLNICSMLSNEIILVINALFPLQS